MKLILYILFLILASIIGVLLYADPGHLEFSYQDWLIEMPLWVAVASIIIVLMLISAVYNTIAAIKKFFNPIDRINKNLNKGFSHLAKSEWGNAEKMLLKAAANNKKSWSLYLSAARAAHEQNAFERRDLHLTTALRLAPKSKLSIGITKAELQVRSNQLEEAAQTLIELRKTFPKHKLVLKMLAVIYSKLEEWHEVNNLIPQLRKQKILTKIEIADLESKIYLQILEESSAVEGKQGLLRCWQDLPRKTKTNQKVTIGYCKLLLAVEGQFEAEKVIHSSLKQCWNSELIKLYGRAIGNNLSKQISIAENWLRKYPDDPNLLLTVARLCLRNKLWGKARSYLEACISIEPNPDAYAELGRLLGLIGEEQQRLDCYQEGLLHFASVMDLRD